MKREDNFEEKTTAEKNDHQAKLSMHHKENKELSKMLSEFSVIFHNTDDGVIVLDEESNITLLNNTAEILTGWSSEEAVGRPIGDVVRLIDYYKNKPCENPVSSAIKTGEPVNLSNSTLLVSRDGSRRFISGKCAPVPGKKNRYKGAVLIFRDITRSRKNEEAVIESDKKYKTILENSYDIIYEVDTTGRILYVNPPCEELTGYTQPELINSNVFDYIHPDDLANTLSVFQKAAANMIREQVTFRARDKSGNYRWLECTGNPYLTTDGEIRGVVITRDITDRVEAREALAKSETLFRAMFENAAIGIALVDLDGRPITANPTLENMLGYSLDELKEMVFTEFTHPEDASKDWEQFQSLIAGEIRHYQMHKRFYRKDGKLIHGWLNVSRVQPGKEGTQFVIATVDDVTDRISAEYELTALNKLMEAVNKFIDLEEVYEIALDTIMKLENIDMAMIYLVDEEKKEAVLETHRNLPEEYLNKASRIPYPRGITWKVINSGQTINIEDAQNDKDIGAAGRALGHHSLLGIPIISGSEAIGVIWFLSYQERKFSEREMRFLYTLGDQFAIAIAKAKMIEELKRKQEQLIQSEKLASIGQLISSIAHEINNPLTPIIGYSQRLLAQNDLDEKQKKSLEIIHNSAQRVFKIIDKLLSFSRKYVPVRTLEDINNLLEKSLEFREYQLKLANIEIDKDLYPDLPKTMVDVHQIQQVFTNIILNAEEAMIESRQKGNLGIKTRLKNKDTIEIVFTDNGPGISKEILGKVFDPFFTTKEPGKGTGLGLFVAYSIMQEHGGVIHASNNQDGGTIFILELPVMGQDQSAPADFQRRTVSDVNAVHAKRVLIVDDEEVVTGLIKTVLEDEDNIVDVATNGRIALDQIKSNQYDLIICDIRMPEVSGMTLYKEIEKSYPELADRVMFITGDPSYETMEFLNHVDNPYIVKPFKVEKFKTYINEIFANDSS